MRQPTRAISIKQPHVERILRGKKKKEYRSRRTNIRERVWLYASKKPANWPAGWRSVGKKPGELPTGVIVGSVEIVDCLVRPEGFTYVLARPKRLRAHRKAKNHPQPIFWRPKF